jgi:PAS domain S-box-containing protein
MTVTFIFFGDEGVIEVNESFLRLFGYTNRAETIGLMPWDFSPETQPDGSPTRERAVKMVEKAKKEGHHRFEWMHQRTDGSPIPMEVTLTAVTLAGDKPFILCVLHDLTDQKAAEKLLRTSEEVTRLVLETALDAVITITPDSTIMRWNTQAEATFGHTSEEAVGSHLVDLIIPEQYRDAHNRGLEKFLETGEGPVLGQRIEITALHKGGHEFPIELAINPISTDGGFEFSAFIRDISERKEAESKLADLARFPDENPNGVLRIDREHAFIYANEPGQHLIDAWIEDKGVELSDDLDPHVTRAFEVDEVQEMELQCGGRTFLFTLAPALESGYINLYVRDVTAIREAEESLKKRALESALLHRATEIAMNAESIEQALQECIDAVCELTGWPVGHAYVFSDEGDRLVPTSLWHMDDPTIDVGQIQKRLAAAQGPKRKILAVAARQLGEIIKAHQGLLSDRGKIHSALEKRLTDARVKIREHVYSGVEVRIGDQNVSIRSELDGVEFSVRDDILIHEPIAGEVTNIPKPPEP